MAFDEAMLERVARHEGLAIMRTYAWSEPTLSLGYFQRLSDMAEDKRWRSVPIVRRATGGGAIWHHHELTYALALPSHHPRARPHTELYHSVHEAIAGALRRRGVEAGLRGDPAPSASAASVPGRPFLCFADRDPVDVVCGGFKVVGGAQRRRAGAILQHGSILLAASAMTPQLPGISDLCGVEGDPPRWASPIVEAVIGCLGLDAEPAEPDAALGRRALELERATYRDPAWTARR
jgi:lipoate-protein ligase A